jgi:hypothetical protein
VIDRQQLSFDHAHCGRTIGRGVPVHLVDLHRGYRLADELRIDGGTEVGHRALLLAHLHGVELLLRMGRDERAAENCGARKRDRSPVTHGLSPT